MPLRANAAPIYLRPLAESDFNARYVSWFRDPEVTRFIEARNITREDAVDHLRRGEGGRRWRMYAICEMAGGCHVGNVKIGPIDREHGVSDLVTVIGERAVWGRGYARLAIALGIEIAFGEMNVRKLSASIDSRNIGSIKAYTAAGFAIEARLKDHFQAVEGEKIILSDKVYVAYFNPRSADGGVAP